jgi:alpha-N-arabinofuranosidase
VDWSGEWPLFLGHGKSVPELTLSPLNVDSEQISFAEYSDYWKDELDQPELKYEWNFLRTPTELWHEIKEGSLILQARKTGIEEVGNPSFLGRRLQHFHAEFSNAVHLEAGKSMEAGLVAFQNEKFFYKLVVQQEKENYALVLSSASEEFARIQITLPLKNAPVYLKMEVLEGKMHCLYSMDGIRWNLVGGELDARHLSTKVAGGYVGTYLGLYAFANDPAEAVFDWAHYEN